MCVIARLASSPKKTVAIGEPLVLLKDKHSRPISSIDWNTFTIHASITYTILNIREVIHGLHVGFVPEVRFRGVLEQEVAAALGLFYHGPNHEPQHPAIDVAQFI